ncbi:MAG TPA: heme-binding protein [Mycobacterium sp.]|uniref:heme-binding protein n=1 Tax=Mycobacterium sp. TaxID=1785 RepID=UPI002D6C016A|nr:heme-binding protein [Mycobacterium sp.]HZU46535.1 heme-binding protein [Mycobacterium sp.]
MKLSGMTMRRQAVGIAAASCVLGGLAATTMAAPSASAAPDCSPAAVNDTVSSATGQARQYLDAHPDANAAVTSAFTQPRPQAAANLRSYFTAHPQEYYDLRGILAPIGDTERQCNTTALSPDLQSAYNEFMAG